MKNVVINLILVLIFCLSVFAQGTTQYVYDANGRLTHVISASGQVSVYEYDFAGNLTRIGNEQNPVLLISNFSPGSGNIGTQVIIRGVGFNIIAAQNAVQFNGVSAVVLSSTLTELTVTVPIGATTGKVQVTNTIGTAISSANFTILQGIPTISSFTPTTGKIGDAVTINGSGFSAEIDENTVKFNKGTSTVSNSGPNLINTTVPVAAASGKISVATDFGEGVSSQDFFVVPDNFTVGDVSQTARLNYSQTYPVNIPTPKKLSLFVFEGTAGSKIHINLQNVTGIVNAVIKSPNNANVWQYTTTADAFQENTSLLETGTYSIYIQTFGPDPASVDLTLYQAVADINETILTDGTPKTVNITSVGQKAKLNFSVEQKNLILSFQDVTVPNYSIKLFRETDQLVQTVTEPLTFIDNLTGNFYILFDPAAVSVGSATFSLQAITDVTENIQIDGTPKTVDINTVGQNAKLNFSVGQTTLVLSFQDVTAPNYSIEVYRDNGQLIQTVTNSPTNLIYLTGNFYILFNPQGTSLGSATFTLQPIPNISETIETNGNPVTLHFTVIGQNGELSFSATAGQNYSLRISDVTAADASFSVVSPSNQTIYSDNIGFGYTGATASFSTSETGTYKIIYDPLDFPGYHVLGDATFRLTLSNDVVGNLVINDPLKTFTSTIAGQGFRLTFAGTQGQRFYLKTATSDFNLLTVKIITPDQTDLVTKTDFNEDGFIDINNLPVTGTYTLSIKPDPNFSNEFGSLQLQIIDNNVFIQNNPSKSINAYFIELIQGSLSRQKSKNKLNKFAVPTTTYHLNAVENEVFSFKPLSFTSSKPTKTARFVDGTMTIYKPDGTVLDSASIDNGLCNITLPVAGEYVIEIAPLGGTQEFVLKTRCGSADFTKTRRGTKKKR